MILPVLLLAAAPAEQPAGARFAACAALARTDAAGALKDAQQWQAAGGGIDAFECAGLASTTLGDLPAAARSFEAAAKAVDASRDDRAAGFWAQAGNAWLGAGQPAEARTALDAALSAGSMTGLALGEAQLDRARALVALGDTRAARADLDGALINAGDDPLSWLLSATLARREGDVPRAKKDIGEALRRSPDDAAVQLEAGNIAATARDEAGARAAWVEAVKLAPQSPAGRSALAALKQFDAPSPPAAKEPPAAPAH